MVDIGHQAPDFTLKDQARTAHTLSEKRGTPVLLVFDPFTFTGVGEGELGTPREPARYTEALAKL